MGQGASKGLKQTQFGRAFATTFEHHPLSTNRKQSCCEGPRLLGTVSARTPKQDQMTRKSSCVHNPARVGGRQPVRFCTTSSLLPEKPYVLLATSFGYGFCSRIKAVQRATKGLDEYLKCSTLRRRRGLVQPPSVYIPSDCFHFVRLFTLWFGSSRTLQVFCFAPRQKGHDDDTGENLQSIPNP
jgi:hypothetical protein